MPPPRRTVFLTRPPTDGIAVLKVVETDEAGWESPAWYAAREVALEDSTDRLFVLGRLGGRTVYHVRVGATIEACSCECLGSGGDGSAICRHAGALFRLVAAGYLPNFS